MTLVTLHHLLAQAEAGGYAVGAFNVSDLNQAYAVMTAAKQQKSPVIVQAIAGVHPYESESWWWRRLRELLVSFPEVEVALHLDHGRTLEDCRRAIDAGFTSVMIDASRVVGTDEPSSFPDNVARTAAVVKLAHELGVSVEGELGTVGGAEATGATLEGLIYADPEQAAEFVELTGVDALAVAVGTSHGSVKFTTPDAKAALKIDLIKQIKSRLPNTFLVLHGSSSIPAAAVEIINANGGNLPASYGIAPAQKAQAVQSGIRKINQGTDSHLVWVAALRQHLADDPITVEPSVIIGAALTGMIEMVAMRMREFGSAGRSS
ncbi:ketose-bisphosphate aldolase [Scrofimicrobium sp. R131]|uniref:Ketose-bisphosphate aldolase n=1 Tax=Scrofimicrobium appendicitidis TaxID=3079930 RepID=A0AAU7V5C8_9ACTO